MSSKLFNRDMYSARINISSIFQDIMEAGSILMFYIMLSDHVKSVQQNETIGTVLDVRNHQVNESPFHSVAI